MPRYFFNVNGTENAEYGDGEDFLDKEAAWHEATLVAGEIFKDVDGAFRPGDDWKLEVTDENGKPVSDSRHRRGSEVRSPQFRLLVASSRWF
jgi:hypothetical protein